MDASHITALLPPGNLFAGKVQLLPSVDSTNTRLAALAAAGAPEGTALLAEEQTAGRGRQRRQFLSPKGAGLYLSVLLRPRCTPEQAVELTSWVGVAVCDAVQSACRLRPQIKWTNDIILNGKKLCGILTEMGVDAAGALQYVVAGVGVNLRQSREDFARAGLEDIATSLALEGLPADRDRLAAALLIALSDMARQFPAGHTRWLARYRADCLTPGRAVTLLGPAGPRSARAVAIDDRFGLVVEYPDGRRETVTAGEVSVRGVAGYV